jgi:hypothetical protein
MALGFDGALFHDSVALVGTEIETGFQFLAGLWEKPQTPRSPSEPEWKAPEAEIDARVRELFAVYTVWRLYADPPYWQAWIAAWRGTYGEERVIEWWTNRRIQMRNALEGSIPR